MQRLLGLSHSFRGLPGDLDQFLVGLWRLSCFWPSYGPFTSGCILGNHMHYCRAVKQRGLLNPLTLGSFGWFYCCGGRTLVSFPAARWLFIALRWLLLRRPRPLKVFERPNRWFELGLPSTALFIVQVFCGLPFTNKLACLSRCSFSGHNFGPISRYARESKRFLCDISRFENEDARFRSEIERQPTRVAYLYGVSRRKYRVKAWINRPISRPVRRTSAHPLIVSVHAGSRRHRAGVDL